MASNKRLCVNLATPAQHEATDLCRLGFPRVDAAPKRPIKKRSSMPCKRTEGTPKSTGLITLRKRNIGNTLMTLTALICDMSDEQNHEKLDKNILTEVTREYNVANPLYALNQHPRIGLGNIQSSKNMETQGETDAETRNVSRKCIFKEILPSWISLDTMPNREINLGINTKPFEVVSESVKEQRLRHIQRPGDKQSSSNKTAVAPKSQAESSSDETDAGAVCFRADVKSPVTDEKCVYEKHKPVYLTRQRAASRKTGVRELRDRKDAAGENEIADLKLTALKTYVKKSDLPLAVGDELKEQQCESNSAYINRKQKTGRKEKVQTSDLSVKSEVESQTIVNRKLTDKSVGLVINDKQCARESIEVPGLDSGNKLEETDTIKAENSRMDKRDKRSARKCKVHVVAEKSRAIKCEILEEGNGKRNRAGKAMRKTSLLIEDRKENNNLRSVLSSDQVRYEENVKLQTKKADNGKKLICGWNSYPESKKPRMARDVSYLGEQKHAQARGKKHSKQKPETVSKRCKARDLENSHIATRAEVDRQESLKCDIIRPDQNASKIALGNPMNGKGVQIRMKGKTDSLTKDRSETLKLADADKKVLSNHMLFCKEDKVEQICTRITRQRARMELVKATQSSVSTLTLTKSRIESSALSVGETNETEKPKELEDMHQEEKRVLKFEVSSEYPAEIEFCERGLQFHSSDGRKELTEKCHPGRRDTAGECKTKKITARKVTFSEEKQLTSGEKKPVLVKTETRLKALDKKMNVGEENVIVRGTQFQFSEVAGMSGPVTHQVPKGIQQVHHRQTRSTVKRNKSKKALSEKGKLTSKDATVAGNVPTKQFDYGPGFIKKERDQGFLHGCKQSVPQQISPHFSQQGNEITDCLQNVVEKEITSDQVVTNYKPDFLGKQKPAQAGGKKQPKQKPETVFKRYNACDLVKSMNSHITRAEVDRQESLRCDKVGPDQNATKIALGNPRIKTEALNQIVQVENVWNVLPQKQFNTHEKETCSGKSNNAKTKKGALAFDAVEADVVKPNKSSVGKGAKHKGAKFKAATTDTGASSLDQDNPDTGNANRRNNISNVWVSQRSACVNTDVRSELDSKSQCQTITKKANLKKSGTKVALTASKKNPVLLGCVENSVTLSGSGRQSSPSTARSTFSMTLRKGRQKREVGEDKKAPSPTKRSRLSRAGPLKAAVEVQSSEAVPLAEPEKVQVPSGDSTARSQSKKLKKVLAKKTVTSDTTDKTKTPGLKFVGAHCSIAGGVSNAVAEAAAMGAKAFGLFVRNGRTWKLNPLNQEESEKFKAACKEHGYPPHLILPHGSYLLNCGSSNPDVLHKSRETLIHELNICEALGLKLYNFHPGSACGEGSVENCIQTIADSINLAHKQTKSIKTVIENMSCQGQTVGGKLDELKAIIDKVEDKSRIGVCLDTCHAFAAGFDLSTQKGYEKLMDDFQSVVGLHYLSGLHLNDSKGDVGCHLDRHENIGKGKIGLAGFRRVMNDPRLANIPMILETPLNDYAAEIRTLYSLEGKKI